jgi:hypothetical protein
VSLDRKVLLAWPENEDPRVILAFRVRKEILVTQDLKANEASKVLQDQKDPPVPLDQRVTLVLQGLMDQSALLDPLVLQDLVDQMEQQELPDLLDQLVKLALQELKVQKDLRALQELQVILEKRELQARQDLRDLKARLVLQGLPVLTDILSNKSP